MTQMTIDDCAARDHAAQLIAYCESKKYCHDCVFVGKLGRGAEYCRIEEPVFAWDIGIEALERECEELKGGEQE